MCVAMSKARGTPRNTEISLCHGAVCVPNKVTRPTGCRLLCDPCEIESVYWVIICLSSATAAVDDQALSCAIPTQFVRHIGLKEYIYPLDQRCTLSKTMKWASPLCEIISYWMRQTQDIPLKYDRVKIIKGGEVGIGDSTFEDIS